METHVLPIVFILMGGFTLIRSILFFNNEEKLNGYLSKSPKGKIWVSKLGMEKTVSLSKKIFIPLSIVVSCGLIGFGIWQLLQVHK